MASEPQALSGLNQPSRGAHGVFSRASSNPQRKLAYGSSDGDEEEEKDSKLKAQGRHAPRNISTLHTLAYQKPQPRGFSDPKSIRLPRTHPVASRHLHRRLNMADI
ncbi:hypothetical protein B7463_g6117, partial [Scytalidium lignicola]